MPPKRTLHNSTPTVSYDSFLFVDNITNSKIVLKDAKKEYEQHLPEEEKLQQELATLTHCISTLKTTKLFQMDSLRSKIFKSTHHTRNNSESSPEKGSLQMRKRRLRQLIEGSITDVSVKELRECIADPNRRVDPQIIALQSFTGHRLTKSNLLHLIRKIKAPTSNAQPIGNGLKRVETDCQVEIPEERDLMERVDNYLKNTVKANSAYLVRPKNEGQMYQKLYAACSRKKGKQNEGQRCQTHKGRREKREKEKTGREGVFVPVQLGTRITTHEQCLHTRQHPRPLTPQQSQILFAVQNNLFFDLQMLLTLKRSLIHTRDARGNNLLHIAAKSRNVELFEFLMKKAGSSALECKNHVILRVDSLEKHRQILPKCMESRRQSFFAKIILHIHDLLRVIQCKINFLPNLRFIIELVLSYYALDFDCIKYNNMSSTPTLNVVNRHKGREQSQFRCHFYLRNVYYDSSQRPESFLQSIAYRISRLFPVSICQIVSPLRKFVDLSIGLSTDSSACQLLDTTKRIFLPSENGEMNEHQIKPSESFKPYIQNWREKRERRDREERLVKKTSMDSQESSFERLKRQNSRKELPREDSSPRTNSLLLFGIPLEFKDRQIIQALSEKNIRVKASEWRLKQDMQYFQIDLVDPCLLRDLENIEIKISTHNIIALSRSENINQGIMKHQLELNFEKQIDQMELIKTIGAMGAVVMVKDEFYGPKKYVAVMGNIAKTTKLGQQMVRRGCRVGKPKHMIRVGRLERNFTFAVLLENLAAYQQDCELEND